MLQNFQFLRSMASSSLELKITISSAKDLKNVNWRHGSLKPFVSAWVEPNAKSSTKVDRDGDTSPSWNETLHIPVLSVVGDSVLYLEIVHDKSDGEDDTKPIVGSARLSLSDVVDHVGFCVEAFRTLELRRPSGRPQGKIEVDISLKDSLHRPSDRYYAYAAPYSATPAVDCAAAVPDPRHNPQFQIVAAADETGAGTEKVLDVGAAAGALDGLAIAGSSGPLEDNIHR